MEPCIVVESPVNNYHYEGDTTIIRMALSREIQGLCFMYGLSSKLLILTGALLHFLQNACISNGQERVAVQKINPTDKFNHVCVQETDTKGI